MMVTVTVSMNFMKNIAQKVKQMTQVMVRFFHPQEFEFSGTLRKGCKEIEAAWGNVSPLVDRLRAGLVDLIGFANFKLLHPSPKSICFPGLSAK